MRTYRYGNDDNDDKKYVYMHIAYPVPLASAMRCNLLQSLMMTMLVVVHSGLSRGIHQSSEHISVTRNQGR